MSEYHKEMLGKCGKAEVRSFIYRKLDPFQQNFAFFLCNMVWALSDYANECPTAGLFNFKWSKIWLDEVINQGKPS